MPHGKNPHESVAVVDDDDTYRELIRQLLDRMNVPVRLYEDADALLQDADAAHLGCYVLDILLPGLDGISLLRRLREAGAWAPVIFVSGHADTDVAVGAMRDGAVDFFQKPFQLHQLVACVSRALAQSQQERERRRQQQMLCARFDLLSPREREVLSLLCAGERSKEIAQALGISVKTVEEYRASMLRKTRTGTLMELVHLTGRMAGGDPSAQPPLRAR